MLVPATGTCVYLTYILRRSSRSVWRNESRNLELVNSRKAIMSVTELLWLNSEDTKGIRSDGHSFLLRLFEEDHFELLYPPPITCWRITWQRAGNGFGNWRCDVNRFNERFEYSLRLFIFRLFSQSLRPCYRSKLTWSGTFKNDDILNSAEGI